MIVCDAGGGTVDLISYKITRLEPLQVIESVKGNGGLYGGVFVNERFEACVKARLGLERFHNYKSQKPKAWRMAVDYFEDRVKRWFGSTSMDVFEVPFPGIPDNEIAGIEDGCFILTADQVQQIFEPVVHGIIHLVSQQVQALRDFDERVSAILCVGGFGQSAYLQKRLKAHFQTDLPPAYSLRRNVGSSPAAVRDRENQAIEVMVSTDSWTACVRGALQRGLQDAMVLSRKCRFHYGVLSNSTFREEFHPLSSRFWCPRREVWLAADMMKWYIKQNETVELEREIRFEFWVTWDNDQSNAVSLEHSFNVRASASERAPLMSNDPSVFTVCTLTTDLSDVPAKHFGSRANPSGKIYYYLEFELVMKIDSADIEFGLRVDGVSYGSVTVAFSQVE